MLRGSGQGSVIAPPDETERIAFHGIPSHLLNCDSACLTSMTLPS